jgi:predicted permease
MGRDLRYALRALWSDRGFAAMAVLSLAVGIGANTAIFSLVNGVLLRPLEFPAPERLVALSVTSPDFASAGQLPINLGQLVEWRKRARSFESIGAYRNTTANLTGDSRPELLSGAVVSANFLHVLGVVPRLGREFAPEEDLLGRHRVVILADSLWRRRFGADPGIVGRSIRLYGGAYTVVGVLPPGFQFPKQRDGGRKLPGSIELLRPLGYEPADAVPHVGDLNYQAVARLRDGVSLAGARAELAVVETRLDHEIHGGWRMIPAVEPLRQRLVGDSRQGLLVLLCAVGAVLLVLCVNLANLSLVRAAGRSRDAAIRVALGASRARLARQSLLESGILALAGGGLGVLVALLGMRWLVAAAPVDLPRLASVTIDGHVLLFALVVSAGAGMFFGVLPAWRSGGEGNPFETLKSAGRSSEGRGGLRLRNVLVGCEVGLCAALLVTAGLFLASFVRVTTIDRGFDVERILAVDAALPGARYAKDEQIAQFFTRVLERARALPGVEAAAVLSYLPLQGETWIDLVRTENDPRPDAQLPTANLRFVSPGLFGTLRIPIRAGRDFAAGDRSHPVAIVSESLARKLWPRTQALGRRLMDAGQPHEVVGVVADARSTSLESAPADMLYIPLWQRPQLSSSIVVRTAMDPRSLAAPLREIVASADRDVVPVEHTLVQLMAASVARRRFQTMLVFLFAAAALALAAFGTYGVVSYTVARRRAELGIRMALGAARADVLGLVLRQGMTPVVAGLAGGALAALWIGQTVASLLFEVSPRDPLAFFVSAAVLLLVSAAACWVPARRATEVNPMEALRADS